jgi:hypothetical protein
MNSFSPAVKLVRSLGSGAIMGATVLAVFDGLFPDLFPSRWTNEQIVLIGAGIGTTIHTIISIAILFILKPISSVIERAAPLFRLISVWPLYSPAERKERLRQALDIYVGVSGQPPKTPPRFP